MIECVQKALASTQHVSPILTPDVRAFKLTEHEKQVLEAYEHLKARNWSKLNARSTQPESICEEYLACLQAKLGGIRTMPCFVGRYFSMISLSVMMSANRSSARTPRLRHKS